MVRDQFIQFLGLLEGHELVMREQVQAMKGKVGESVQKLGAELEKLNSLWNQFKPRSEIFTTAQVTQNRFGGFKDRIIPNDHQGQ